MDEQELVALIKKVLASEQMNTLSFQAQALQQIRGEQIADGTIEMKKLVQSLQDLINSNAGTIIP